MSDDKKKEDVENQNEEQAEGTEAGLQSESVGDPIGDPVDDPIGESIDASDGKPLGEPLTNPLSDAAEEEMNASGSEAIAQSNQTVSPTVKKESSPFKFFLTLVVVLLLIVILSGIGYGVYNSYKQVEAQKAANDSLSDMLASLNIDFNNFKQVQLGEQTNMESELSQLKQSLSAAELRLQAQQKRILSMSTTSREDWLLAEAEYLLKLANQRVLVERKADSAIALFEEADAILRDLGDPDLFPLRDAINKDLVALKLAKTIDVEGIYLELSALAAEVEKLPLVPEAFNFAIEEDVSPEPDETSGSFQKFLESFKRYYRVIDHEEKPAAILPPDQTAYLHLNLRMMIERAQLAMLREQQDIYSTSLQDAERWVRRYFPSSLAADQYERALADLRKKEVVRVLPDVSESLELLKGYIADLHKLTPANKAAVKKNSAQASSEKPAEQEAL